MLRMFARMRSSGVRDLRLENQANTALTWLAGLEGAAFDGDTLHLAAAFQGSPLEQIALTGLGSNGSRHTIASALVEPPMATSNSPTYGQSNSSMQDERIMRHRR